MNYTMSNNTLDLSNEEFEQLLNKSSELVLDKFNGMETRKAYHAFTQNEVESWFDQELPESGMDHHDLLAEVKEKVLDTATDNMGHHMYGYVMAGGTQMSIIAEKLVATINQNTGKWHLGPAVAEIEKRVISWGAQMIGYDANAGGILTSGGSAANLVGLTVARNIFFEKMGVRQKGLFGLKPFTVYASKEIHGCVDKSLQLLGIGTDHLRKIETNADFTINLDALQSQINDDISSGFQPFCLIGSAGTVNTGAIDDLDALSEIANTHNMWFHIDGAYGGLAAALPSINEKYKGLEKADSVAIDFHKWLYQPFEVGCVFVKSWDTLRKAYFKKADYLDTELEGDMGRVDFNEHCFQLSRSTRALKVWMSLKAYGFSNFRKMIQKDIDLTHYLANQIEASDDFEMKSQSDLAVVCFRYTGNLGSEENISSLNEQLIPALEKDGRVFITGTKLNDEFVLRACVINHRKQKETMDYLLNVIRDVAKKIQ